MKKNITNNNNKLQPWDDALAILAAIIAEKYSATTKNTNSFINKTGTGENGDMAGDNSDQ